MQKIRYYKIYKKAAKQGGWSSGKLNAETKWGDIYQNITRKLTGSESVLDIGTAEGKRFLRLASKIKFGVGIDSESEMIKLADKNAKGFHNMSFKVMSARKLKFPAKTFDIVIARHAPIDFKEALRVLKPGGILISQQVHENDKLNLKKMFHRGQNFNITPGTLLKKYLIEAKQAGFKIIKKLISNRPYYFKSRSELYNYLTKSPTIPQFGKKDDNNILKKFILKNKTTRGIKSNSSRFLIELKKLGK